MQQVFSDLGTGYRPQNIPNLDVKWEKQEQFDVGLDIGFLHDRINLTVDWYQKESKDMLMELQMASYMGTQGNDNSKLKAPMGNYGHIRNTGLEITLSTHPIVGKFEWDSEAQISFNKNKLMALNGTASAAIMGYAQWGSTLVSLSDIGESLYSFYGYVTDGIYKDLEDIETSPKPVNSYPTDGVFNSAQTVWPGDIKYKDINGDGIINENDRTNIGSPMPKFTYGWTNTFRYKNFDLSIFINGTYGNKILNLTKRGLTTMSSAWSNQHVDVGDRARLEPINAGSATDGTSWYWDINNVRVSNPDTKTPRAIIGDPNDNDRISDRYIEDGTYLRIKNISLGYTFPKKVISKLKLDNLRLYCNIQNLVTFTGYSGYDPEIGVSTMGPNVYGVDYGRYPSPTTYSFGINMSF
jgi:hypothetical protein